MSAKLSEVALRIDWLLKKVWQGSQTKMARDIGVSQSVISHVVVGRQEPGRKLLAAIASNSLVNSRWLITGEGEPLVAQFTEPGRRALYVARTLFEGLPDDHGDCLGDMLEVPLRLYRPTRYWFEIPADCPLVSVSSLKIAVGDLMLFEPDQKGWPDSIKGHPCIIKDTDNRLTFTHVTDQQDGSVSISSSTDKSRDDSHDGKRFREFTFHDEVPSQKVSSQSVKAPIIAIGIFRMGGFTMS